VTLNDIVVELLSLPTQQDQESIPTIYAEEPWSPTSEAVVAYGSLHGGLPSEAAKRGMVRFIEVASAAAILKNTYSEFAESGLYSELCLTLINRVHALVQNRDPYGYKNVAARRGDLQ
jgi:hypothetical protein